MQAWNEIVPNAQKVVAYYDRLTLEDAIQIAKEKCEEWDYTTDPHGYCHERPVLVKLISALESRI